jgi:hypothetical protein
LHAQTPLVHTPDMQSLAAVHGPPSAHFEHVGPPQSTPVSAPFFTPSMHVGARQVFAVHTPLWQSVGTPHGELLGHLPQSGPPQSTAVSLPSFIESLQSAAHDPQLIVVPHPSGMPGPHAVGICSQVSAVQVHILLLLHEP